MLNLPNVITLARILLVPVFVLLYVSPPAWTYMASAICFGMAAFTDWLDGYLARRLNQTTPFGAFLDPVADKLIVVSALVILIGHHANWWLTLPGLIIVGREIVISALREWMAEMNSAGTISVNTLGKVKTTIQMIAIALLLAQPPQPMTTALLITYVLIYVAAFMTLWSMTLYLQAAWPTLKAGLQGAVPDRGMNSVYSESTKDRGPENNEP